MITSSNKERSNSFLSRAVVVGADHTRLRSVPSASIALCSSTLSVLGFEVLKFPDLSNYFQAPNSFLRVDIEHPSVHDRSCVSIGIDFQ